jgi:hypothetical protein
MLYLGSGCCWAWDLYITNVNCMLFLFLWYGLRIEMFNNMSCCTNYVVAFTFLSFVTEPYYDLYVNKFPAGELSTLLAPNML